MIDVPRTLQLLGIDYREQHRELWASCPHPDHDETRPSWSIRDEPGAPGHGHHHCFGCGWGGGPLELAATVIGCTRSGAKTWLEEHKLLLGDAPPLEVELVVRRAGGARFEVPVSLIGGPLAGWATPARRYAEARGVTAAQVERWRICYAVDGVLAGRIVFPVLNERGAMLSYHARSFAGHEKRYRNAGRVEGHDPGGVFGQLHWPNLDGRASLCVMVTEGAIDALACERAGARHIAALGGSEPHPRQLLKLGSWGRVIMVTDGDQAGDRLAEKVQAAIGRQTQVKRAPIPPGRDAAELTEQELCRVIWSV